MNYNSFKKIKKNHIIKMTLGYCWFPIFLQHSNLSQWFQVILEFLKLTILLNYICYFFYHYLSIRIFHDEVINS